MHVDVDGHVQAQVQVQVQVQESTHAHKAGQGGSAPLPAHVDGISFLGLIKGESFRVYIWARRLKRWRHLAYR